MFDDNGSLTSSDGLTWTEESGLKLANNGLNKIELIASVNNNAMFDATNSVIVEDIRVKVGNTYRRWSNIRIDRYECEDSE